MLDTAHAQNQSAPDVTSQLMSVCDYLQHSWRFANIDGFLLDFEGYTLKLLAEQGPAKGAIVEIGSYAGKSTCWLAAGSKAAGREKVYAVDTFTGSDEHQPGGRSPQTIIESEGTTLRLFKENIKEHELDDYVEPVVATSEEAIVNWDQPIRLLFIDADHSYEAVKMDFDHWSPFVVPGGMIAFHDINGWEGVTRFYHALLATTKQYREVLAIGSLHVIQRTTNDGQYSVHANTQSDAVKIEVTVA